MKYYSQYKQDEYLNENFFKNKKNGVFVEIGAHDGVSGSNSLFFEETLHWDGICIEAIPSVFEKLINNRRCKCVCKAAWKENTNKIFRIIDGYSEMLSGLIDCYEDEHVQRINNEIFQMHQNFKDVEVECCDINDLLESHKLFNIDYLSIDVEGSEFEILNHLDFNKFNIEFLTVENNYKSEKIRDLMRSENYELICELNIDDVYKKIKK
jgi:FkbM family methyltransferase